MRKYHIFCPEYVPLQNKGEEAIIRGMADILFPEGNVEFHILDMEAKEYSFVDGFHVYPGSWFYSKWRSKEFGLGLTKRQMYSSACSLVRNGLNILFPNWLKRPQAPLKSADKLFHNIINCNSSTMTKGIYFKKILDCDYLIAGHDGAFDEYDCHVINLMQKYGMRFGVFGTSLKPNVTNEVIIDLFRKTLNNANFIYCRNRIAVDWGNRVFNGQVPLTLAPDPAFGMRPSSSAVAAKIIKEEDLQGFFKKPVVVATTCEPAPIARHCFNSTTSPNNKIIKHRLFLSEFLKYVVEYYNVNLLFLPHATGPGPNLDDRRIARDIVARTELGPDRVKVLENEYSARDLKSLIREAEFLIAERIHSMIGAVGVQTPFLCLGSQTDTRIIGIIGEMLDSEDLIYYLNNPNKEELKIKFSSIWRNRKSIRDRFSALSCRFNEEFKDIAVHIRKYIMDDAKRQLV